MKGNNKKITFKKILIFLVCFLILSSHTGINKTNVDAKEIGNQKLIL